MELSFFFVGVVTFLLFIFLVSLYLLKLLFFDTKTTTSIGGKVPPGSLGWPITGEGIAFYRAGKKGVPESFFLGRTQKYSSNTFRTSLIGEVITVLCGAAGNQFMFANESKLVTTWSRPSIMKIVKSNSTQQHKLPSSSAGAGEDETKIYRKFSNHLVKLVNVGLIDTIARKHFEENWDNQKEVTVYPLVKNYTFSVACWLILSMDNRTRVEELSELFTTVMEGLLSVPLSLPGTKFSRAIKAAKIIRKDLVALTRQRKMELSTSPFSSDKKPLNKQDLLTQMILSSDEQSEDSFMSESDIADKILGLILGGHEPPTVVITCIMKHLAEHPEVYNEVLKEQTDIIKSKAPGELLNSDDIQKMKYSWNVARESMRLATSSTGAFRQALTDFNYEGYHIPKGSKLLWSGLATHKNPEYFPEPEKFKPSRFEGDGPAPFTYVPFGGGPRMCPGREYAKLETLVFMHHAVIKYRWEKLISGDDKLIFNPLPLPAKGLPIRLHPHPTIK
ncbi:hypothetical protein MKX01_020542 [Papaver californicum]|nr:hypothetical protein MKX01_020542 [Papaver californicum]